MKVVCDQDACTGHGRCYTLAPDIFEPDDRGHCVVLVDELTPETENDAKTAAANCPEHALSIE